MRLVGRYRDRYFYTLQRSTKLFRKHILIIPNNIFEVMYNFKTNHLIKMRILASENQTYFYNL